MPPAQTHAQNWVQVLDLVAPDLSGRLSQAGILDDESYLAREHLLPRRTRGLVGLIRRDLLLLERAPLEELVRACPPWVRDARLDQLGLPEPLCEKSGAVRARDLLGPGSGPVDPLVGSALRLLLYRAGAAPAPEPAHRSAPPRDRVSALVEATPPELRTMPLSGIPFPTRVERALRREGLHTIGDLAGRPDSFFRMLPYFGERSLEDLLAGLRAATAPRDEGAELPDPEPCP